MFLTNFLTKCRYQTGLLQYLHALFFLVWKPQKNNEDVSSSTAASNHHKTSIWNKELDMSISKSPSLINTDKNSDDCHNPHRTRACQSHQPISSQDPQHSCIHDLQPSCHHNHDHSHDPAPSCSHDPQNTPCWDSIQDKSLARYANNISKGNFILNPKDRISPGRQQSPTNQESEKNKDSKRNDVAGKEDVFVLLDVPTLKSENVDSSEESIILSSDENKEMEKTNEALPHKSESGKAQLNLPSSQHEDLPKDNNSCLDGDRKMLTSSDKIGSKRTPGPESYQNSFEENSVKNGFRLVRPEQDIFKCHSETVPSNWDQSVTLCTSNTGKNEQGKEHRLNSDLSSAQNEHQCMHSFPTFASQPRIYNLNAPASGAETKRDTSYFSSQEAEVSDVVFEQWTCQSGGNEEIDNSEEMDDLDRNLMTYLNSQKGLAATAPTKLVPQSAERNVVNSTQADKDPLENKDELPVTVNSSGTILVENEGDVFADGSKQNSERLGHEVDRIHEVEKISAHQIKMGPVVTSSLNNKSLAGDEIIIVSSSSESNNTMSPNDNGSNEIQLRGCDVFIEHQIEEQRLQELVASGSHAINDLIGKEKLKLPSTVGNDEQQHEELDQSWSIFRANVSSFHNQNHKQNTCMDCNPEETAQNKTKRSKRQLMTRRGKKLRKESLFKVFPMMPGWSGITRNRTKKVLSEYQKHNPVVKDRQRCSQKRKLYNNTDVLDHVSPVVQNTVTTNLSSTESSPFTSHSKCRKVSVIPVKRSVKQACKRGSVLGFSRKQNLVCLTRSPALVKPTSCCLVGISPVCSCDIINHQESRCASDISTSVLCCERIRRATQSSLVSGRCGADESSSDNVLSDKVTVSYPLQKGKLHEPPDESGKVGSSTCEIQHCSVSGRAENTNSCLHEGQSASELHATSSIASVTTPVPDIEHIGNQYTANTGDYSSENVMNPMPSNCLHDSSVASVFQVYSGFFLRIVFLCISMAP